MLDVKTHNCLSLGKALPWAGLFVLDNPVLPSMFALPQPASLAPGEAARSGLTSQPASPGSPEPQPTGTPAACHAR
jgi:hypothetical protein